MVISKLKLVGYVKKLGFFLVLCDRPIQYLIASLLGINMPTNALLVPVVMVLCVFLPVWKKVRLGYLLAFSFLWISVIIEYRN